MHKHDETRYPCDYIIKYINGTSYVRFRRHDIDDVIELTCLSQNRDMGVMFSSIVVTTCEG